MKRGVIHKYCPTCKREEAEYYFHSGCRSCIECQRTHYFQGNGEDGEYADIIKRWNAEDDRKEERERLKREKALIEKDQMRLL